MLKTGNSQNRGARQVFSPGELYTGIFVLVGVFVLGMGLLLTMPLHVRAQSPDSLIILPPETENFPTLSVQFKPRYITGVDGFDLGIEDLTVSENGRNVPVVDLEKQHQGVHFTLAINGDRWFDLRDASGVSPYQRIQDVLIEWVGSRRFASGDTLSLFTQEFAAIRNTTDREGWIDALVNYQPNFRTMTPNLDSLEAALRAAEERVVPFGVDKAILYITPPPSRAEISELMTLAETARAAGVQVNVWMLGEELFLTNEQGGALIDLAAVTGGQFLYYTGLELPPMPETYLENLGYFYTLRYESGIRERGTYAIQVMADLPDGELRGESGDFVINVEPPKPIFLSPPATILRTAPDDWDGESATLNPTRVEIEYLIEFPDQYPRELAKSWLYVDGRVVDTLDEGLFLTNDTNQVLIWDVADLAEPGEYMLQVKIEDRLGLQGETIVIPIQVEVQLPEPEETLSSQQIGTIVVGGILVVSVVLMMMWAGHKFLQSPFAQRVAKKVFDSTRKMQPARGMPLDEGIFATLLPLENGNLEKEPSVIFINKRQMAIGHDPNQVDQVLMGENVSGLHARFRVREGKCWLSDSGSEGGTWVNYERIGRDPLQLQPGDLIHFGDVAFRFTVVDPASPPRAVVIRYEPIL